MKSRHPIILTLLLMAAPAAQAQFTYTISNGTITITGYSGSGGAVTIPGTIDGLPVTTIGEEAFYDTSISSVTIPASLTNIADEAFEDCVFLNAFSVDPSNPAYTSPNGILFDKKQTTLMQYPPHKTGTAYTIPSTVLVVGDGAFAESDYLASVTLPSGLTSIGGAAFFFTALTTITIPATVTNIGDYAFEDCALLTSIYFKGNAPSYGDYSFETHTNPIAYYDAGTSGWGASLDGAYYSIPTVMLNAPNPAGSLQVTITPAGAISAGAYWQVDGGIPQPSGATVLGLTVGNHTVSFSAVSGWTTASNQTIYVSANSTATASGIYYTPQAQFNYTTNGDTITITGYTGSGGTVIIPSTINNLPLTSIGDAAFERVTSLTSVTIPNSVTSIGDSAFANCTSLTNATIPDGVTSIGDSAFTSCTSLASVTIPASVTSIGDDAFAYCTSLTEVYFQGNAPGADSTVFAGDSDLFAVYYLPGTAGWGATFAGITATVMPGYCSIAVSASPSAGGTVIGGGAFASGSSQTVTATANGGYTFANWTENGSVVSSSASYTFTLSSNLDLVANFTVSYTIAVSASPAAGGTVVGGGTFASGSSQTVIATANSGYTFTNWTENGSVVSSAAGYTFTLNGNVNLVANFTSGGAITSYQTLDDPNASTGRNSGTYPLGIDGGNIVGYYVDSSGNSHGFLYNGATYTTLDDPNGIGSTYAQGISGGNIVGWYVDSNWNSHGFLYNGATYTTLDDPNGVGSTYALGIDGGNIVGYYVDVVEGSLEYHGFLYNGSTYTTLDDPNAVVGTEACGISGGNIVGWYVDGNYSNYGFVHNGRTYTTVDDPNGVGSSVAQGIAGGNIVGYYNVGSSDHGFLYNGSTYITLDDPNGIGSTIAQGISGNTIVGYYTDSNSVGHGFTYTMEAGANYTITVSASPSAGGTVNGGGTFSSGSSQTVTASANSGYRFTNWTENGSVVSSAASYTFTLSSNLTLQANFVDTNKPVVAITNVTSGMNVSNVAFTVKGTARDNVAVAQVFYSLNDAGWHSAETGNGWSNWTAAVTLLAGTNTIAACAVDTSGNDSTTNTVKVVCVVSAALTVSTNGLGTLSPNDSGALLQIGKSYSIKATPAKGFAFTNWTGGTSLPLNFITNGTTIQFLMQSNLMLEANFVETNKPTLSITAPTPGQHLTNALVTVSGTAGDNWKVSGVWYQLNGEAWSQPASTNGWTNWTTTVELQAGTNTIKAYAQDLGGNFSTTNRVSFTSSNAFMLQLAFASAQPLASNGLNFVLQISAGLKGHVQVSTDLVNWITLTGFTGTNATIDVHDPAAVNFNRRFYRAVVP